MKDEKAKYLIIDAPQINKYEYETNNIINIKQTFEKNGIPEEFQKIILKTNISLFKKNKLKEYTTGCPLDIKNIKKELAYSNYEDVMNFLQKVDNEGYLKNYLQSIKEFLNISVNLDLLFGSWEESQKNPKQALNLYKKKTLNRK